MRPEHFNPHEREARDVIYVFHVLRTGILIHTSVKLVTFRGFFCIAVILILIHTSVKLVTFPRHEIRMQHIF